MTVDWIVTQLSPAEAELTFVTDAGDSAQVDLVLKGQAAGPRSPYAETLEVAYPLKPLPQSGDAVRARLFIPDPLYWSPQAPYHYQLTCELWSGSQRISATELTLGLKDVRLHPRKGLKLNGQPLEFSGFYGRGLTEAEAVALHGQGVNLLVVPLQESTLPLWPLANRLGFFVVGLIDPEDDALLWHASEQLNRQPCTFGWLFPQSLIGQPQRWHNAVSLLHNQRSDLYLGIKVDELPLGALPGHVAFAVGAAEQLEAIAAQGLPCLGLRPRGAEAARPELPAAFLGWLRRTLTE